MTRLIKDEEIGKIEYNYEEECPECGYCAGVIVDDDDFHHYTETCPECGRKLMLCGQCHWDYGDICDWNETTGCRIERAELGLEDYPERIDEED